MKHLYFIFLVLLLFPTHAHGQYTPIVVQTNVDSVPSLPKTSVWKDVGKMAFEPSILIVSGLATWNAREEIRDVRNRYFPEFRSHYDDYMQFAPAATAFGLKLAGVQGRNNLERTVFSYAAGTVIMMTVVHALKHATCVRRPDGSTYNSFPSGHTANAFMNAAFLHHEYGNLNNAYGVAGYGMAISTGIGRSVNNRHWISDILVGAGIGILSSRLGYFFIDRIYGNKGDHLHPLRGSACSDYPSYLALKAGYTTTAHMLMDEFGPDNQISSGFEMGIDGGYYFSRNWGVGGSIYFTSFPVKPSSELQGNEYLEIMPQSVGLVNVTMGPQHTCHISGDWLFSAKIEAGLSRGTPGKVGFTYSSPAESYSGNISTYRPRLTFIANTEMSVTYKVNSGLGITPYAGFHFLNPRIAYELHDLPTTPENKKEIYSSGRKSLNYFSTGVKLTAFF